MNTKSMWEQRRKRLAGIVEIGSSDGSVSRGYDVLGTLVIIINLIVSVLMTFTSVEQQYGEILLLIERITVIFFSIDYVLRLWTAKYIFDADTEYGAMRKYMLSFSGIVDLLSFLPYFLPIFFPSGAVAFRIFRRSIMVRRSRRLHVVRRKRPWVRRMWRIHSPVWRLRILRC